MTMRNGLILLSAGVALSLFLFIGVKGSEPALARVTVYKSPSCGCCTKWIDHLEDHGFEVTAKNEDDLRSMKRELGIPGELSSCHTGLVDGYVLEGHIPATDIAKLLKERPTVVGLSVPGMPIGSPGMEVESGHQASYEVLAFDADGNTTVFSRH